MEPTRAIIEWWNDTFSDADKDWMASTYQPLSIAVSVTPIAAAIVTPDRPLLRLLAGTREDDAFRQLTMLSTWFSKPGHEHCAIAFASKAMEFYGADMPVLDRHFALGNQCISFYRWRDTVPGALENAIAACEACISIEREAAVEAKAFFGFIPAHHCFRQLRIIEEKRGNFGRAIELCEQAKAGGWADDWDKDIARLVKKRDAKPKPKRARRKPEASCEPQEQMPTSPPCTGQSPPSPSSPTQPPHWRQRAKTILTAIGGRWRR